MVSGCAALKMSCFKRYKSRSGSLIERLLSAGALFIELSRRFTKLDAQNFGIYTCSCAQPNRRPHSNISKCDWRKRLTRDFHLVTDLITASCKADLFWFASLGVADPCR